MEYIFKKKRENKEKLSLGNVNTGTNSEYYIITVVVNISPLIPV
jgi:hypothetical protein